MVKQIVTYLSIFGGGCALGVLATRAYFDKHYRELADIEIESVKEVYKRKTIALEGSEKKEEKAAVVTGNVHSEKDPIGGGLFMNMTPEHMKEMQINYNTISAVAEDEHPIEDDYKPYMIEIDEFDEVHDGQMKLQYSYYVDDDTLVSEEDEVVNAADTVSTDILELFENMEDEVCYVRNESLGADYEITKVFGSYAQIAGDDY